MCGMEDGWTRGDLSETGERHRATRETGGCARARRTGRSSHTLGPQTTPQLARARSGCAQTETFVTTAIQITVHANTSICSHLSIQYVHSAQRAAAALRYIVLHECIQARYFRGRLSKKQTSAVLRLPSHHPRVPPPAGTRPTILELRERPPPKSCARRSSSSLAPSCPKQGRRPPPC